MALRATLLGTIGTALVSAAVVLPSGAGAAGPPRCRAADLAGAIIDVQGAAGSRFGRMILVNKSGHSCHTRGFIGAQLIGTDGRPLPTHVHRDHSTPTRTILIRSGAAGALQLRWSVVPSGSRPCKTARWLRVTPPDGTRSLRVFFGDTACRGDIDIRAVTDPSSV